MSRSSKLLHREPIPRGFVPKLKHYTKGIPSLNMPVAVIAALALMIYPAYQFTQNSDYFDVNTWNVEGLELLTEAEIMWLIGHEDDVPLNIFAFDDHSAAKLVTEHPGILHTVIEKKLPNQINVYVYERHAEALLVTEKDMLLVDYEGVIYAKGTAQDLLETNLPIITIADGVGLEIGSIIPEEFLTQVILYQETLRESGSPLALEVSEYHLHPGAGLEIVLRNGMTLKCGFNDPSQTIPKYHALVRDLQDEVPVRYVDLRLDSHVPWQPGVPRYLPTVPSSDFAHLN